MQKKILFIIIFFWVINCVCAQNGVPQNMSDTLFFEQENVMPKDTAKIDTKIDTIKKESFIKKVLTGNLNWNFVATPFVNFQNETNWGFGIAGAYYIKPKIEGKKTGNINFTATYTLKKQFKFNVTSITYLDKTQKWLLYSSFDFKHFPDNFYGIGNRKKNLLDKEIGYNSDNIEVKIQPQINIKGNWLLGINTHFRWENSQADSAIFADIPTKKYGVDGFNEYFMFGFGGVVSYDSRDNLFYSAKGLFFKTTFTYYPKIVKKSYQMGKIQVDFRHFIPIYKELIFAYQFVAEANLTNQKPFQMLSTIGGAELLRGIRQGVWRDDAMAVLQTELRIPIWKIFKAAVFAGVGDVYSLEKWQWATPKIGYGVGLRVKFNKSKANIRLDISRQNFGKNFRDSLSYYITVNEAF